MASDAAAAAPPAKRARLPPGIQQQHPHHQQLQPGNGLAQCSAAPLSPSSPLFLDSHHQAFISHAQNGGRSPQCVLTREAMQDYLRTRPDCCVTILHAKVAQKSYGNEKRFFCPPPCVYMTGDYWARDQPSSTNGLASPPATTAAQATGSDSHAKTNNTAAGAAAAAGGGADESAADTANGDDKASPKSSKQDDDNTDGKSQEKSKTPPPPPETGYPRCFMGIHEGENGMSQLPVNYKGYSVAKTLFISDSDKRKNFQLAARLIYGDGHDLGSFYSNRIKVISKPSKKKQSVKNAESVCIASGTTIALFNRLRSQTVSTRYLHVPRSHFEASSNEWGAFTIHLLPDDEKEDEEFTTCEGFIHYGHTVKLVCTKTGIALPRLVIRKVDKQVALVDADDPVSQLHKVAFYMKDTNRMYLCLSQDRIIQFKATKYQDDDSRDSINDGACWTIISTDVMRYTFHEAMGPVSDPVTPVPRVLSMNMTGCNSQQYVELIGEDFHDNMTVWFADLMVDTFYRCSECILAVVPDPCALDPNYPNMNECLKVPLVIVREDGVVYDTAREYTYPPPMPNTAGGAAAGLAPPPPPSSNLLSMQYRQAPQPPPAAAPLQPEYMLQDHHQQHHRQQHHRHHAGGVGLPAALDIAALGNSTMAAAPPTRPLHYIT